MQGYIRMTRQRVVGYKKSWAATVLPQVPNTALNICSNFFVVLVATRQY